MNEKKLIITIMVCRLAAACDSKIGANELGYILLNYCAQDAAINAGAGVIEGRVIRSSGEKTMDDNMA